MPLKLREALRQLLQKGCVQLKNNHGSHQKIKNPVNNKTTVLPIHLGKDIDDILWRKILKELELEE